MKKAVWFLAFCLFCGCVRKGKPCPACQNYVSDPDKVDCQCDSSGQVVKVQAKPHSTVDHIVYFFESISEPFRTILICVIFWAVFYCLVKYFNTGDPG
jgi:hypothetical protein